VALLTLARVKHVSAHLRATTRCGDVGTPLAEVVSCGPDDGLLGLLGRLGTSVDQRALVFDAAGLAGIVSPSDISRAMQQAELSRPS